MPKRNYNKPRTRNWPGKNGGNPGGIYATNPKTKMCDKDEPKKEKEKNLGNKFVEMDESKYRLIRADLPHKSSARLWKELNKKYGINGSFNFYYDLLNNDIDQYKKWFN